MRNNNSVALAQFLLTIGANKLRQRAVDIAETEKAKGCRKEGLQSFKVSGFKRLRFTLPTLKPWNLEKAC